MNRGRKLKYLRKFILKHGTLYNEEKMPPDKSYRGRRKGYYFAAFSANDNSFGTLVTGSDKYEVYQGIVRDIHIFMYKR